MPQIDVTIEQLEAEILKSRFETSETEVFLSRRQRKSLAKAGIKSPMATAWLEGYELGVKQGKQDALMLAAVLGTMVGGLVYFFSI